MLMPKSRKNNMVVRRADDKIEQPCVWGKMSSVQTLYTYIHARNTPSTRMGGGGGEKRACCEKKNTTITPLCYRRNAGMRALLIRPSSLRIGVKNLNYNVIYPK